MISGSTPVIALSGVGASLAAVLAKLNLNQVQDLWFHLPLRYLDRTRVTPIGQIALNTSVLLEGTVSASRVVLGKKRSLVVNIEDATGSICLRFFHFNAAQKAALAEGSRVRCYGDIRLGRNGLELYHPEYTVIAPGRQPPPVEETLTPVYPLTEGIGQTRMRKLVLAAVAHMQHSPPEELLPISFNHKFGVNSLGEALTYIHRPPANANTGLLLAGTHPCQLRLAFEELLAHHLALNRSRDRIRQLKAPKLSIDSALWQRFIRALPYSPTRAQHRVIEEIYTDLRASQPMLRLVQGDVGSGKTLVAAAATLAAFCGGCQVALVAPTEILAEQHRENFTRWLSPLGFNVGWLVGNMPAGEKRLNLQRTAEGVNHIVIGTHALFQQEVQFKNLGLVIIDEQHRFGVHQRLALRDKAARELPHQLVMTATPIPRTLAMTAYADLDLSIIDELPPGRSPVSTALISQGRKDEVIERVRSACTQGRQVYWVCPLVEDSESLMASAAQATARELTERLPELRVGLVHGRLKGREKEATMTAFKRGELQLLVATTVIEVGVDVPNATVMIIENPERLGLAQLHQLRGRVGRGSQDSYCLLLYGAALSKVARNRLDILRDSNDGFAIAEADLAQRGPGELLGTRQTGDLALRLANLEIHAHLLQEVIDTADQLRRLHPHIDAKLINRWFPDHEHYLQG